MATYAIQEPAAYGSASLADLDVFSFGITGGQTLVRGDVGILASGLISKAAANPAGNTLVGIAVHGTANVYFTGVGGAAAVKDSALFGASVATTALMSSEPANIHMAMFHNSLPYVFSVLQGWNANLIGTTFGLSIDGTTSFFQMDNTQGNKPFTLVAGILMAPGVAGNTASNSADVGARAIFVMNTAPAV